MKKLISILALIGLAQPSFATIPVIDYSHIAQDAWHEVVNLTKWTGSYIKETETQLNTLRTYENTILQVARYGNPAALKNLPIISTIAELYSDGLRIERDYQEWQAFLNPKQWQSQASGILSYYQYGGLQNFTSASGYSYSPPQGLFQWDVSRWNVANAAQDELKTLETKRQALEQKRDDAVAAFQTDTDASQRAYHHGAIDAANGALAEVAARENQVLHQMEIKKAQIAAGESVYKAQQAQQQVMGAYQTMDQELMQLPTDNFRGGVRWAQ